MSGKITNLRQIEQISLREQVAGALRAAIVSGELEPGDVYSAPALGAKFGVSATPVREAMLDLVRENLVTTVPNKGYRVTTMDEADLDDITECACSSSRRSPRRSRPTSRLATCPHCASWRRPSSTARWPAT